MNNKPKVVTGTDSEGMFCITRPKLKAGDFLLLFILFLALFSNGQTVTVKQQDGTYTATTKAKTSAPGKDTGLKFKDSKGKTYPILQSESGATYYMRTSAKGNIYKAYIKL